MKKFLSILLSIILKLIKLIFKIIKFFLVFSSSMLEYNANFDYDTLKENMKSI